MDGYGNEKLINKFDRRIYIVCDQPMEHVKVANIGICLWRQILAVVSIKVKFQRKFITIVYLHHGSNFSRLLGKYQFQGKIKIANQNS